MVLTGDITYRILRGTEKQSNMQGREVQAKSSGGDEAEARKRKESHTTDDGISIPFTVNYCEECIDIELPRRKESIEAGMFLHFRPIRKGTRAGRQGFQGSSAFLVH